MKVATRSGRIFFCLIILSLSGSMALPGLYAQTLAGFTASDTLGCTSLEVQFENTGSTGGGYSYHWQFTSNPADSSNLENPSFTYHSSGDFLVTQTVKNTSTQETASAQHTIVSILTPPAKLTIDSSYACVNGDVHFNTGYSNKDSVLWIFGDGNQTVSLQKNYMSYAYSAAGVYTMKCITYYHDLVCSDTTSYTLYINGPEADLLINPDDACKGDQIDFTMNVISDVDNFSWAFGDGTTSDLNPAQQVFDTTGKITVSLYLYGSSGECMIQDTFYLHEVKADFGYFASCENEPVRFNNLSKGNDINQWDFGSGTPIISVNPEHTFSGQGTFPVKLVISDIDGCQDSITRMIPVNPLPDIILDDNLTICPGVGGTISVSSSSEVTVFWSPVTGLGNPTLPSTLANPDTNTLYTVTITDVATNCQNTGEILVSLQDVFQTGYITMDVSADSIVIGDTISFSYLDELGRDLNYIWTPELYLIGCTDCPTPKAQPLESIDYQLEVSDENLCAVSETFYFPVWVREEYILGLPDAFTPNGDNINEIIKVEGWGIKAVEEFSIYNRNGQQVFFGDNLDAAWDGTYNEKPQPVGTYQYYVRAEMWDDNTTEVRGTFTLLR
ncbi:MAG: PKD domain-containing protein [Bacteroidales bacterium]|nr:PKD domain-containing protein [Bacteroidales bacterium]